MSHVAISIEHRYTSTACVAFLSKKEKIRLCAFFYFVCIVREMNG